MEQHYRESRNGYCVTPREMFANFDFNRLELKRYEINEQSEDNYDSRLQFLSDFFKTSFKMVIEDVIEKNVTFYLPVIGKGKISIHMIAIEGNWLKKKMALQKFANLDFIKAGFKGYTTAMFFNDVRNNIPKVKNIYLNYRYQIMVNEKTNNGMPYGNGKIDTTVKDYYDRMQQIYPYISMNDIKIMMKYTWKLFGWFSNRGCDAMIIVNGERFLTGNLRTNSLEHYNYYIKKLIIKLRMLYIRKKIKLDNYYYFALSQREYENYIKRYGHKIVSSKFRCFGRKMLYRLRSECELQNCSKQYIFKVREIVVPESRPFKYYTDNFCSNEAELVAIRRPMKFRDILVSYNIYEILWGTRKLQMFSQMD